MANNTLKITLEDLKNFNFVLTRFNSKFVKHDDLDVLVHSEDFEKFISTLEKYSYHRSSHDQALGGRITGMQVNLTKPGRIKIDLHQDFTWRRKQYIDIKKIWENSKLNRVDPVWDAFLIMINVIFEKTYFISDDFEVFFSQWQKIKNSPELVQQTVQYGWNNTFINFKSWMENQQQELKFPLFLPAKLVLYSYLEKFDLISFLYYLFFRTRYLFIRKLPY
ncbi:MAG: hypothetical protein UR81_C0036G0007 [Candidatus Levybacteria bacterium GW2011_GWB1_35_5]|nr:MAG: hypothetical protein UR81_C0036G0007 [Candidatus Levybacteria bacterium GW2011_GWB1_35_5]